jgi:16S rRNA (uracil1498-N3)-methyltransferase
VRPHLPRFLIDHAAALGEALALRPEEAKHARVRRLAVGDPVALFDGAGHSYVARLESLTRAAALVRIVEVLPTHDGESTLELTLAVAALKADRFDWVIEKATELGVARIRPFHSAHTVAQPSRNRQGRWRQIALAAAKQCGRSAAPAIDAPADFAAVLALPAAARILFAEDGSGASLSDVAIAAPPSLLAIVGAEGGFSPEELGAARRAGCHLVSLGPRILRAETAAVTAAVLCQSRWGDLGGAGCAGTVDR